MSHGSPHESGRMKIELRLTDTLARSCPLTIGGVAALSTHRSLGDVALPHALPSRAGPPNEGGI
jgi:hypothetical protein